MIRIGQLPVDFPFYKILIACSLLSLLFSLIMPTISLVGALPPIWGDKDDRRFALILGFLSFGNVAAWGFEHFILPKYLAPALGLEQNTLPWRAPLFEGSAPLTDFTEITTFPNYLSDVSWASPPAVQFQIMLKSWMAHEWQQFWDNGTLFFLFCTFGIALHVYGTIRLAGVCGYRKGGIFRKIFLFTVLVLALYPIHFALDRGNVALHNTGFIILGVALYLERSPFLAAFSFGLAAISKITPVAFALSFLLQRRWHVVAFTIGIFIAGVLVPAFILNELFGYQLNWMIAGQRAYAEAYAVDPKIGLGYSASLFSLVRLIAIFCDVAQGLNFTEAAAHTLPLIRYSLPIYSIMMALVGLDLFLQTWRKRISPAILVSLLTIYQIMAPPIIADYYLTVLVIPLLIFGFSERLKSDYVVLFLALIILIPKTYFWLPLYVSPLPYWISIGVPINSALVAFLYFYVRIKYVGPKYIP